MEYKLLCIIKESLSKSIDKEKDIKKDIKFLRNVPQELKDEALKYLKPYTRAEKGKISELNLHPDIISKAKEHNAKIGYSMGIDKDGYYIHTHRARSKSHKSPKEITVKEMNFIESTG